MIAAVLRFGGQATFPPTLPAPTTSARNPNVTPSITSEASIQPTPALGSGTGGGLWTQGGQERLTSTLVVVSLRVLVMFLCCFLLTVPYAVFAGWAPVPRPSRPVVHLGSGNPRRGSGKVATPEDLQLNPQGWGWVGVLCVGLTVGVMSHLEQTRHVAHVANASGGVMGEQTSL